MTPTLHRLFDQGLFTIAQRGSGLEVVTSPLLDPTMLESPDRSFRLPLKTGLQIALPVDSTMRPNVVELRYHSRRVFKGAESML